MAVGIGLIGASLVLWARDLTQLFRGRLGPSRAAAPEFWCLLLTASALGPFGAHRLFLGRYRSAPLFPLLLVLGLTFLVDAAGGFTWALMMAACKWT